MKRIVPEEPKRWLWIHYGPVDEAPTEPAGWLRLRDALLHEERRGDLISPKHSKAHPGEFQGRPCVVLEGVWQNDDFLMGGPFRGFGLIRGERYYLIDLSVYHPPAGKLAALRQLEAIAMTFED